MLQHRAFTGRTLLDEGLGVRPHVTRQIAELGPRQQILLQAVEPAGVIRVGRHAIDKRQHHAIELATERMVRIGAHLVEECLGRGHDLLHQECIGAVELQ